MSSPVHHLIKQCTWLDSLQVGKEMSSNRLGSLRHEAPLCIYSLIVSQAYRTGSKTRIPTNVDAFTVQATKLFWNLGIQSQLHSVHV